MIMVPLPNVKKYISYDFVVLGGAKVDATYSHQWLISYDSF